ncbi:MAG: pseudouridine synthase, partial [Rhodospirillaceae bacterium]|nr:pseudouridine synthase [Rhodospirillaceae bacterium]
VAETQLWLYHKPTGVMTTNSDPEGRPTVFEQLPKDLPRVITVGRLDFNSEGLLLLTNDGELARQLEMPSTGWRRRYRVRAWGHPDPARLKALEKGVTVEGVRYGPIEAELEALKGKKAEAGKASENVWLSVTLTEGKYREVRKVLEHLGLVVNRLIRVAYGPFQLGKLSRGEVRRVTGKMLKEQLGKTKQGTTGGAKPGGYKQSRPKPSSAKPGGGKQGLPRTGTLKLSGDKPSGDKSGKPKSAGSKKNWAKPGGPKKNRAKPHANRRR